MNPELETALARIGERPTPPDKHAGDDAWLNYAETEADRYKAQRDAAVLALRKRGHDDSCPAWWDEMRSCTCGLTEVLKRCSDG